VLDLHLHSNCSDGSDPPAQLVAKAAAVRTASGDRLTTIALTDHDTLAGIPEARQAAAELGLDLIAGCEVSALFEGRSIHLLCYFVDAEDSPLAAMLEGLRLDRAARNQQLLAALADGGFPLDPAAVRARAGSDEGVGRPHVAEELVARGHAHSIQDAFNRFLAAGAPYYVPKAHLAPAVVAEAAHASGALCVVAHPLLNGWRGEELAQALEQLAAAGIDGVEAYYSRSSPAEVAEVLQLAQDLELVATGGSDYHGTKKPDLEVGIGLGSLEVPESVRTALLERRQDVVSSSS